MQGGQVAKDHLPSNGTVTPPPKYHAAFSIRKVWYGMTRIAYSF
jgi:hypothetical protein